MEIREIQQLEILWDKNIFPDMIRMPDGLIYKLEKIILPPNDYLQYLKKVRYGSGRKKIELSLDDLLRIEKIYSFHQMEPNYGQR